MPVKARPAIPKGSSHAALIGLGLLPCRRFVAVAEALEIVRVEVAVTEPGVIVAGENEQFSVLGIPLQESAIALLNGPDCGSAVTVKLPDCPAGIVTVDGDALKDTVDGATVDVHPGL